MAPKHAEMDSIVQTIHDSLLKMDQQERANNPQHKPTLFIVCSDHGMNEVSLANHLFQAND
jgi:hypothetical protein